MTALLLLIIYLSKCYISADSPDAASLLRVANVIALLEKEYINPWNLTVTEIAYPVGINDSNYYLRHFRDKIKSTPKEYRLMNKK